jgi:hypothetical protein
MLTSAVPNAGNAAQQMKTVSYLYAQVAEFGIEKVPGLGGLLVRKLLACLASVLFRCCDGGLLCTGLARDGSCDRCMLLIGAFLRRRSLGHS